MNCRIKLALLLRKLQITTNNYVYQNCFICVPKFLDVNTYYLLNFRSLSKMRRIFLRGHRTIVLSKKVASHYFYYKFIINCQRIKFHCFQENLAANSYIQSFCILQKFYLLQEQLPYHMLKDNLPSQSLPLQ